MENTELKLSLEASNLVEEVFLETRLSVEASKICGSNLTTIAIGGPLQFFVNIPDYEKLKVVLSALQSRKQHFKVIGNGSNLLICDRGVADWVLKLGGSFNNIEQVNSCEIEAGGAVSLMQLSRKASGFGLAGLEFAGGIPASIGGAVWMNAGAYGSSVSDVLISVMIALPSGDVVELQAQECGFGYRRSNLPKGAVVVSAKFRLSRGDPGKSELLRAELLRKRKASQPLQSPSFGSVFKNPAQNSSDLSSSSLSSSSSSLTAGALIESVGLKGATQGGAVISHLHGNWILNETRKASAEDVEKLIERIKSTVLAKTGISLVEEVVRWS